MTEVKVFISYSHDSGEHRERALALSERLRQDGVEAILDQYIKGSPAKGWPRWMLDQLDVAQFVLVVCTGTYYRRFRGHEEPGKGKGVNWEGALITQEIYDAHCETLKFVPVFLSEADEAWIPEPLRSLNHYVLTSEENYQGLYDFLLGQAGVEPHPVGTLKPKTRRKGDVLTFEPFRPYGVGKLDISRIDKYAPEKLIGREAELKLLNDAWDKAASGETKRPRVLTFVALGGEGKTSLAAKWTAELAHRGWPGCEAAFAWSFYSQGTRDQAAASSDTFFREALAFFGDAAMAGSAAGVFEKGKRLARLVGGQKALLILDGLEPLQYPPSSPTPGELKDQGISALLKGLAAASLGLCIVTTRYSIPDLKTYRQTTAPEEKLLRLSPDAGEALLRTLGVRTGAKEEFQKLVADVDGHALTLQIMGGFLKKAFGGDIRCRDKVKFEKADAGIQDGHAFRAMAAYAKWMQNESAEARRELALLRLMGLFDRPAAADCIDALLKAPAIPGLTGPLAGIPEEDRNCSLDALETASLLTVHREACGRLLFLDAHPLLREYFAKQVREQHPDAWRKAHHRLFEHLCAVTKEGDQPTLEDLQPLYQAVAHGCQAGLQQEACDKVYRDRIQRGKEAYSTNKLGALGSDLGAVACFFETPWSRVSPALSGAAQAWLLNEAAFSLRALGRLTEALKPMREGMEMRVKQEDLKQVAISAGNLSALELTLGQVAGAVEDAGQSVIYADRSGDAIQRMARRTTYADALHQAGRLAEAEALFCEAEKMQAEDQPGYPLLYSLRGFQYCDLLLAEAEREAAKGHWPVISGQGAGAKRQKWIGMCREVAQRAGQTLKWEEGMRGAPLLDFALHHLTLGRAELFRAILEPSDPGLPASGLSHIEEAVSGLRCAGTIHWIPAGLLTRAWRRALFGSHTGPDSAQADLDEAFEIAERGPMPLFMADIHLYRARLFFREAVYPWESPKKDLAEARGLIKKHGYDRRLGELEDAEGAILK